ncbi:hypothetical protein [Estrella lausannensis]|uniref:Uncharacterized protein n=1 Tax=Estrella lausannensis TaxID=483423 RepID=A0A0H5DR35_9BACT|nr:hypothetical protein [Estrella lausannensis]CRX38089.1 hypothetical protein ELAC_0737 [Estrella lausannensis]
MEKRSLSQPIENNDQKDPVATTIFVGFPLTADLAYDLSKSSKWKEARIVSASNPGEVQEIVFQDKKYVGRYIQKDRTTISELELEGKAVRARLKEFLETPSVDNLHYVAIAQLMLF